MNTAKNIFLVEDDTDDQFIFTLAIAKIENAVLQDIAGNGVDALAKLNKAITLPDLIFMDINMPCMNGVECLTEIIKNPYLKNIPVVILSTSTGQLERLHQLGAKAFIKKPSDEITLRVKIEEMININFALYSERANQTFVAVYA